MDADDILGTIEEQEEERRDAEAIRIIASFADEPEYRGYEAREYPVLTGSRG